MNQKEERKKKRGARKESAPEPSKYSG